MSSYEFFTPGKLYEFKGFKGWGASRNTFWVGLGNGVGFRLEAGVPFVVLEVKEYCCRVRFKILAPNGVVDWVQGFSALDLERYFREATQ